MWPGLLLIYIELLTFLMLLIFQEIDVVIIRQCDRQHDGGCVKSKRHVVVYDTGGCEV